MSLGVRSKYLPQSLHSSMRRLKESKQTLYKNKYKEKLEQMQSTPYTFPVPNNNPDCKCMQNLQNKLDSVESQTRQLKCELLENEKLLIVAYRENGLLERELQSRRKNEESFGQREKKIQENLTSLGHFRQYNVNRCEKSRDDRIASLSE